MKSKKLERFVVWLLPPLVGFLLRFLFSTCRVTVHGQEHFDRTVGSGQVVVATFWHYAILGLFPLLCRHKAVLMVSASKDGAYIARLGEFFGFGVVRGSRNKRGVSALKELIKAVKKGQNAGIVADGSQGPARKAQPGALLTASMSGVPVLPVLWSASSYWAVNSWDRMAFPKPFARVEIAYGKPFYVPRGIKQQDLEGYRVRFEEEMNQLYDQLWQRFDRKEH